MLTSYININNILIHFFSQFRVLSRITHCIWSSFIFSLLFLEELHIISFTILTLNIEASWVMEFPTIQLCLTVVVEQIYIKIWWKYYKEDLNIWFSMLIITSKLEVVIFSYIDWQFRLSLLSKRILYFLLLILYIIHSKVALQAVWISLFQTFAYIDFICLNLSIH